ncbi:flagellar motor switch protein FliM [Paenibacillus lactis]|uniref:Uncharacterized protein n=2 Tax=Paenibacillus lactis TaxID=228574 RepID=G4HJW1_9BACL|nr:hypothetical protein PaelaDRAFT_4308 [Paenibacillus lactis 154]MBP1896817.1 flagellar motor switch protein FliM [Paenibacillus lactis]
MDNYLESNQRGFIVRCLPKFPIEKMMQLLNLRMEEGRENDPRN